ncbi:winged helix-turn-helix domain-containing protein [Streptomyces sparsogenes]|uniref:GntR family transcriptional regulator n=1 Tax=Streptomyces sparsogenes TaxID=67365 RepID=UPI0033D1EB18
MSSDREPVVDTSAPAYVYMQVADHVAWQVRSGRLQPGARLAGERDLAREYGVSIATARRAVQELRDRGLVTTLPAKGTFVTESRNEPDS